MPWAELDCPFGALDIFNEILTNTFEFINCRLYYLRTKLE